MDSKHLCLNKCAWSWFWTPAGMSGLFVPWVKVTHGFTAWASVNHCQSKTWSNLPSPDRCFRPTLNQAWCEESLVEETTNVGTFQMSSGNWGRTINIAVAICVPPEPATSVCHLGVEGWSWNSVHVVILIQCRSADQDSGRHHQEEKTGDRSI